jgi:dienelactone hydrolase
VQLDVNLTYKVQTLELILIVGGALCAVMLLKFELGNTALRGSIAFCLAILASLQIYFEGHRWHMVGAYFAVALSLVLLIRGTKLRVWLAQSLVALALLSLGASALAATLFPVFKLPALTGPYQVGTVTINLSKSEQGDRNINTASNILVMQMFYPADVQPGDKRSKYMPQGLATRFKPQLAMVESHAFENARLSQSESQYPVLIYLHSWNGNRLEDSFLVQDLASRGYVVVCVDDPSDTPITVFANGSVLRHPGDKFLDGSSPGTLQDSLAAAQSKLAHRVADVRFVLNELARINTLNASSHFYKHLDLEHIGALGWSFGGTTAAAACRADHRLAAGANLDGFSFGVDADSSIPKPFLLVSEDNASPSEIAAVDSDPIQKRLADFDVQDYGKVQPSIDYKIVVRRAKHTNFSDSPLYSRLRSYTLAGAVDPYRAMFIIDNYVAIFFDKYLRGKSAALLEANSPEFPDAVVFPGRRSPVPPHSVETASSH